MTCPRCNSSDWKLLSLVHKEGLTHVETNSRGGAFGISNAGIGAAATGSKSSGSHQTELSKLAAPPAGFGVSALMLMGTIIFGLLGWIFSPWWFFVAVACVVGLGAASPAEKRDHEIALSQWENRRMCLRCGTFFDPPQTPEARLQNQAAAQNRTLH